MLNVLCIWHSRGVLFSLSSFGITQIGGRECWLFNGRYFVAQIRIDVSKVFRDSHLCLWHRHWIRVFGDIHLVTKGHGAE